MVQQLRNELADSQHKADSLVQILRAHEQKHQCETLLAEGRTIDAATTLIELTNTASEETRANALIMNWLAGEILHSTLKGVLDPYYQSLRIVAYQRWKVLAMRHRML